MTWSSRSTRWALLAYCLLAVLILGGVTWGTILTRHIAETERQQTKLIHENDFRNTLTRISQRIESYYSSFVFSESARPYSDYFPYSHPNVYRLDGTTPSAELLLQPSPLIDRTHEPWMLLHFHADSSGGWQSPQATTGERFSADAPIPTADAIAGMRHAVILADLRKEFTFDTLRDKIVDDAARDRSSDTQCRCVANICLLPNDSARRAARNQKTQTTRLPNDICAKPAVVQINMLDSPAIGDDDDQMIELTVSPMETVWLENGESRPRRLALMRFVETSIPGLEAVQGILIDWEGLRAEILEETAIPGEAGATEDSTSPNVELVPVRAGETVDDGWMLANLPVAIRMDAPSLPGRPVEASFMLIGGVWCAALVILGAVGLGIRNVLGLAERRTQFAYAVTHELRTPLTTLRLYSDMLAGGLVRAEDKDRYIQTLNVESERLSDLVDEVLEYARVENHRVQLDHRRVKVGQLLDDVRNQCLDRCTKAGMNLVIDVNGLSTYDIETDPQLVRQVVSSLIDNACKYSNDVADPTITLRAQRTLGDRICIDVKDQGPGVDPASRNLIFKPFHRAPGAANGRTGGIGLGLALARSWAQLLRGRLELIPPATGEHGACFRLTLPVLK